MTDAQCVAILASILGAARHKGFITGRESMDSPPIMDVLVYDSWRLLLCAQSHIPTKLAT